ncbi:hypothetical protein V496_00446, partial [Pseudogymnoascus sp. VKM F-4515 (FW-2607)]
SRLRGIVYFPAGVHAKSEKKLFGRQVYSVRAQQNKPHAPPQTKNDVTTSHSVSSSTHPPRPPLPLPPVQTATATIPVPRLPHGWPPQTVNRNEKRSIHSKPRIRVSARSAPLRLSRIRMSGEGMDMPRLRRRGGWKGENVSLEVEGQHARLRGVEGKNGRRR